MQSKTELRKYIREQKKQFTNEQLIQLSQPITSRLLCHERVKCSKTILMYYSLSDEVYTHDVLQKLIEMGKDILLPVVVDNENMIIRRYKSPNDLAIGAYNIMEPIGQQFEEINKIDLCVVPGMAFDSQNNRLGRGKGYYDRFLYKVPESYKIGVCFDFQKLDTIPTAPNDIKVDEIL